jgi:hypothetical protein
MSAMLDKSIRLRSALQYASIDHEKDKLQRAVQQDTQVRNRLQLIQTTRAVACYLDWLDQHAETEQIRRFLEKRMTYPNGIGVKSSWVRVAAAVEMMEQSAGHALGLTVDLLQQINALLDLSNSESEPAGYREQECEAEFPGHRPFHPDYIPAAVERSFEWFGSQGSAQLHPLERSILALTRLAEIAPFRYPNLPTLVLGSSYYLAEAGFPLPVPSPLERTVLIQAVGAATQMRTQALVDLFVKMEAERLADLLSSLNSD